MSACPLNHHHPHHGRHSPEGSRGRVMPFQNAPLMATTVNSEAVTHPLPFIRAFTSPLETTRSTCRANSAACDEGSGGSGVERTPGTRVLSAPSLGHYHHTGSPANMDAGSDEWGNAGDIHSDVFPVKQRGEGTREMARRERRRAQNRRAAQRCRAKRRMRELEMLKDMEKELLTMRSLETELQRVTSEKQELEMTLFQHGVRLPRTEDCSGKETETVLPFCFQ